MPGNAGTPKEHNVFNIDISFDDHSKILEFVKENMLDLVIIGPEVPLVEGLSDLLEENDVNVFGLESSLPTWKGQGFFKRLMADNKLPTAQYSEFSNIDDAISFISKNPPIVKYDGLAAGKGVDICENIEVAKQSIIKLLKPNEKIIIEDF